MPNVKTAISMDEGLFERVERLARRKKVSRSQLLARAAEEYIRREENAEITARLDAVYGGEPDAETKGFLEAARTFHRETPGNAGDEGW